MFCKKRVIAAKESYPKNKVKSLMLESYGLITHSTNYKRVFADVFFYQLYRNDCLFLGSYLTKKVT